MKKVVVVLPTFNERGNIAKTVEEVLEQEKRLPGWRVEALIVDSSSPDGTGEVAKKLAFENPRVHFLSAGRGLGVGLIEGHKYSLEKLRPDVMAQLDADGQAGADVLVGLVKAVEEGFDIALGSRFIEGGKNYLSFSRRLFSAGSSWACRVLMGPSDIREFTNSARAFTPQLFKKINLERLPWKEKTFIIQPAFLNEAVVAGAKYKEVPLIFKDRAEGYSKNKTINYTYDIITYALDARLHKWGINIPLFKLSRRLKTFFKFGVVGFTGTAVDFIFYNLFIRSVGIPPATSKVFSAEVAIFNNFTLNNIWTFKHRNTNTKLVHRFLMFNLFGGGGVLIAAVMIKILHTIYGDGFVNFISLKIAYYNLYFFVTIPVVLVWNFTINNFITWRHRGD